MARSSLSLASFALAGPGRLAPTSSTALHHAHRQLRQASTEAQRLKGVIKATSTGLFKLTLPLPAESPATEGYPDECRFFLHPKQPLSFVTSLINSEAKESGLREGERITFHALQEKDAGKRWSGATELGDFVQDAAKDKAFVISLGRSGHDIEVHVPSFKERTDHLRKRLRGVSKEIQNLEGIREQCDQVATGSAKKIAFLGFGGIALYWVAVYRLTFGPEGYGWDVMEPVTYLVGLREVSYRSMFEITTSRRRAALYASKGFDQQRYEDLIEEGKDLRRAIQTIAHDYDVKWTLADEGHEHSDAEDALQKAEAKEEKPKKSNEHSKEDDEKL